MIYKKLPAGMNYDLVIKKYMDFSYDEEKFAQALQGKIAPIIYLHEEDKQRITVTRHTCYLTPEPYTIINADHDDVPLELSKLLVHLYWCCSPAFFNDGLDDKLVFNSKMVEKLKKVANDLNESFSLCGALLGSHESKWTYNPVPFITKLLSIRNNRT